MSQPDTIADAPLMLSVSGARGIVGRSMTPAVAADFAAAFASFLHARAPAGAAPLVCLGRDSRPSGFMLAAAASAGLTAAGCDVIDLGLVTTPTAGVMIDARGAAGGLVITASHNPGPWNGLKCLGPGACAPPAADAADIIGRFRARRIDYVRADDLGQVSADDGGPATHVERVLGQIDAQAIRARNFSVVLDSVNGAGGPAGRMLLERLNCEITHLHADPTGQFAHPPEPVAEHLVDLAAATREHRAAVGFAQDPDADRLALVDEQGTYIGEEYTLVLAAARVLQLRGPGVLATNLSTSRMLDDLAAAHAGTRVVRTAVGEANVVEAMRRDGALVGGEGNGGVIWPAVCHVRDSLSAMALVLGLLAKEDRPLSALVADRPRYVMIKRKFDLAGVGGAAAIDRMLENVRVRFSDERVNDADGVRVDFEAGWVHLRPSNTEPIVRLIGEAGSTDAAEQLIADVAAAAGLDA
ncbi:MAG: phosphoglucosamine mutase [Planctomycetota bacterium]|jgi:phosphomannomutase